MAPVGGGRFCHRRDVIAHLVTSQVPRPIEPPDDIGSTVEQATDLLARYIADSLPNRDELIELCARHLALVLEANRRLNLTSLTTPLDLAVKHVLDSLQASKLLDDTDEILDLGSGAGFPGVPLAALKKTTRFVLTESIGKKAAFLSSAVETLGLRHVEVVERRAEELLQKRSIDTIVVRAVGPTAKLLKILRPVRTQFRAVILYKGPNGQQELREAQPLLAKMRLEGKIAAQYELPEGKGERCLVRLSEPQAPPA